MGGIFQHFYWLSSLERQKTTASVRSGCAPICAWLLVTVFEPLSAEWGLVRHSNRNASLQIFYQRLLRHSVACPTLELRVNRFR